MAKHAAAPIRADAARNRARILEVARAAVAAGDLAPSLNDIAREAGVGVGTVYRHFTGAQALLEALVDAQLDVLGDIAMRARAEVHAVDGVALLVREGLAALLADRSLGAVLAGGPPRDPTAGAKLARIQKDVTALVKKARGEGALRDDVGFDDLRRLMCGVEHAVRSGAHPKASASRYADILLAGLAP